jgi:hypothetical protein
MTPFHIPDISEFVMPTLRIRKAASVLAAGALFLGALSGCGEKISAAPTGIYIDSTTDQFLQKAFEETKICTGFSGGKYEEVSVVMMPPTFPCKYYTGGCSGEYVEPNLIKVGSLYSWRHEVVHYLLQLNTGDPDASHQSPFFQSCV